MRHTPHSYLQMLSDPTPGPIVNHMHLPLHLPSSSCHPHPTSTYSRPPPQPPLMPKIHTPIHIMQKNCRVSKDITLTLINDINPAKVDFILIQEPYVYPNSSLSIASPKWRSYYPTQPCHDPVRPRSLLLVNATIDPATVKQIPIPSPLITVISLLSNSQPLQIFNIYNPPNSDLAFDHLEAWLHNTSHSQHTFWAGDFNKHHSLWLGHEVPD